MQSLGGVIGGEPTGCDEATTEVFIECALFDPIRVALTGRRHQIVSDARQRFERGIDPALMPDAVEAATAMVLELCGGEPGEVTEAGSAARLAARRDAALRAHRRSRRLRHRRRTKRSARWNAWASRCRAAMRRASPSRCRPGATTSRRGSRWTRSETLDPGVAREGSRGLRRDRAGVRSGGGGAAHPRPRRRPAGLAAACLARAARRR